MAFFLLLVGAVLFGAAAALVARAIALSRLRMDAQVEQIKNYGYEAGEVLPGIGVPASPGREWLDGLASRIGSSVGGSGRFAALEVGRLRAAGLYNVTAETFHGYRVMGGVGLPAFILLLTVLGGSFKPLTVALLIAIGVLAFFTPMVFVNNRAQKRLDQIDRALPELIDVLTATIEAGMGFAGSLQLCADRFRGPLGQELRLTLQEQSMGLSTERALANMQERCETPSVRSFVRAVSQGETLGVSIGTMMRNLAEETRTRRRQAANEKVQKAPVKMLFPLVFLVFPSLLIVLLYPAVHELTTQLGSTH